jgi:hypothetical protein
MLFYIYRNAKIIQNIQSTIRLNYSLAILGSVSHLTEQLVGKVSINMATLHEALSQYNCFPWNTIALQKMQIESF